MPGPHDVAADLGVAERRRPNWRASADTAGRGTPPSNTASGSASPSSSSARAKCVIRRSAATDSQRVEALDGAHDVGRRDPEAVHAGVDLDEHLERSPEPRELEHPHLLLAVHDDRRAGARRSRAARRARRTPRAAGSGACSAARAAATAASSSSSASPSASASAGQQRAQTVPVGVGLDDREHLRAGAQLAHASEVRGASAARFNCA